MRAGSPDNGSGGDSTKIMDSGKAVASTGPVLAKNDRLDVTATLREPGEVQINKDSENPGKTHAKCELGSYNKNRNNEIGGATGRLGMAQS